MYSELSINIKNKYKDYLTAMGRLSPLFSENKAPYLHYRAHENIFCFATNSENLSRSDIAIDAKYNNIGIGLKTFLLQGGHTFQKIAEFNAKSSKLIGLSPEEIVKNVIEWRNDRLEFTIKNYSIDKLIYHCISRSENEFQVSEYEMEFINKYDITEVKSNSIHFKTEKNLYKFDISKSTLYKKFDVKNHLVDSFFVEFDSELESLVDLISKLAVVKQRQTQIAYLPLYSTRGKQKIIFPKSGLNQWNAAGRKRNKYEIYIPIKSEFYLLEPDFFPPRDQKFKLKLPNGNEVDAKVCQDGGKALMSNPNNLLGEWILGLKIKKEDGQILEMKDLERLDIDSVVIEKFNDESYAIDFAPWGAYEKFRKEKFDEYESS